MTNLAVPSIQQPIPGSGPFARELVVTCCELGVEGASIAFAGSDHIQAGHAHPPAVGQYIHANFQLPQCIISELAAKNISLLVQIGHSLKTWLRPEGLAICHMAVAAASAK